MIRPITCIGCLTPIRGVVWDGPHCVACAIVDARGVRWWPGREPDGWFDGKRFGGRLGPVLAAEDAELGVRCHSQPGEITRPHDTIPGGERPREPQGRTGSLDRRAEWSRRFKRVKLDGTTRTVEP